MCMKDAVSLLNMCSWLHPKPTDQAKAYARPASKKLSQLPEGVLTLVEKMIYRARYMLKKNKIVCISCAI